MNKLFVTLTIVLLGGCAGTTEAADGGGAGQGGGGAATTDTHGAGGAEPTPWDGSPYLGFGYDGAPCSAQDAFAERDAGPGSSLASSPILVPVNGFVTRVTVAHVVQSALGTCSAVARRVLLSEPTSGSVPVSPGVREEQSWSATEVAEAPLYPMPEADKSRAVQLGRDLSEPMYVKAGQYLHVASVLDDSAICALGCGKLLDGTEPPKGHAHCTVAETWEGCGPMPDPGASSHVAYVAWVDFAAE